MNRYALGLDAGGTKTLAVMADDTGHLCGLGSAGPGNADGVGEQIAEQSLRDAIVRARGAAGDVAPSAVFAGIAGVVSGADRGLAREVLAETAGSNASIEVDHDCRIALAGALSGRPGIVVIAGTGASVFGRNAEGADWRANGWGSLFGDEGSSYWVAMEGVRAALRAEDGRGPQTLLGELLFSKLGITDANDLLSGTRRNAWSRPELAALAPLVTSAAEAGDDVAQALIGRAADELAGSVAAVARGLGFSDTHVEVALVGGLLRSHLVRRDLQSRVLALLPAAALVEPELPPVVGAVLLALARLHHTAPANLPTSVMGSLRASCARLVPAP